MTTRLLHETVPSSGASIEVTRFESNPTPGKSGLVLVACGGSINLFDKVSYPVAEMQLRGYGESKWEPATGESAPALSDYLKDIDNVIAHTLMERPVLLGYSHSGFFAAHYAIANPGKLGGLILAEPALFNTADELQARIQLAEEGRDLESLQLMLKHVEPFIEEKKTENGAGPAEAAGRILANINHPHALVNELRVRKAEPVSEALFSKLTVPVLAIGGLQSHVASIVIRLQRLLPTSYVWWIKGAAHTDLMSENFGRQMEAVISSFQAGLL